jgi:hypothetical protein
VRLTGWTVKTGPELGEAEGCDERVRKPEESVQQQSRSVNSRRQPSTEGVRTRSQTARCTRTETLQFAFKEDVHSDFTPE